MNYLVYQNIQNTVQQFNSSNFNVKNLWATKVALNKQDCYNSLIFGL